MPAHTRDLIGGHVIVRYNQSRSLPGVFISDTLKNRYPLGTALLSIRKAYSCLSKTKFPQLTLFPRVSETSETNLRNQCFSVLFGHIIHLRAVL